MSAEQVIDLVTDENDDVIVIDDDSPKSSISEDCSMDAASTERMAEPPVEQKPFASQEPISVDMDIEEVIPIPISNQTWVIYGLVGNGTFSAQKGYCNLWRNMW